MLILPSYGNAACFIGKYSSESSRDGHELSTMLLHSEAAQLVAFATLHRCLLNEQQAPDTEEVIVFSFLKELFNSGRLWISSDLSGFDQHNLRLSWIYHQHG